MNVNCTIICFDYGGYYSKEGDNIKWCTGGDRIHTLAIRTAPEEVTYQMLVEKICKKMKIDEASTQLKLSFFPMISNIMQPSDVWDDEDVFVYVMQVNKDGCRNLLNVEVLEVENQNHKDVDLTREVRESDIGLRGDQGLLHLGEESEHLAIAPHVSDDDDEEDDEDNFRNEDNPGIHEDNLGTHEDNCPINEDDVEGNEPIEGDGVVKVGVPRGDGLNFPLDQTFCSRDEVKLLVLKASHLECYEFEINKTEPERYVLRCAALKSEGCKWYLRVLPVEDSDLWYIKTYEKIHTCLRQEAVTKLKRRGGSSKLVVSMLGEEFPGKFKTPKPKVIMEMAKSRFGVDLSYSTAWRGKNLAANVVRGSPEESYMFLECYLYMLEKTNAGTKTSVEWDEEGRFQYLFFALGACIEGYNSMRKVIIVDATHLKHSYGGVLMVAMCQDPDHHHYPIAFGVADKENEDSWMWFMKKLKEVVPDRVGTMFISDRNRALIKSVRTVFRSAQHGYCIYHLSQNVKKYVYGKKKETVADDYMICAEAYTEVEFIKLFDAFQRKYPTAVTYLNKTVKPEKWARCYFPGDRYNIVTTNSVESVNAVFVEARMYTLLPMIDMIIKKMAEWFNKQRKAASQIPLVQKLVPEVNKVIERDIPIARKLESMEINHITHEYNVLGKDGKFYAVNLSELTCTCGHFDRDRYPCVHAIQAIIQLSGGTEAHIYEYASNFYLVKKWLTAYKKTIYLVPHMDHWLIPDEESENFHYGYPPAHEVTMGPNQQARFKSPGERRGKRRRRRGAGGTLYEMMFGESQGGESSQPNPEPK